MWWRQHRVAIPHNEISGPEDWKQIRSGTSFEQAIMSNLGEVGQKMDFEGVQSAHWTIPAPKSKWPKYIKETVWRGLEMFSTHPCALLSAFLVLVWTLLVKRIQWALCKADGKSQKNFRSRWPLFVSN